MRTRSSIKSGNPVGNDHAAQPYAQPDLHEKPHRLVTYTLRRVVRPVDVRSIESSEMSMRAWKPVVLASAVCFAMCGCASHPWSNVRPVPVAEVDAHGISLARARQLIRGDRAEAVILVLGEPADRMPSCVPGEVVWRYPIRAWNDTGTSREIVPAVLLRMSFDRMGTLTDWSFADPLTGRHLPVLEGSDEASRWFESLSRSPAPIPPRIKLDETLIRGQTTQREVERILGQWQPDLHCGYGGAVPVVRKASADSGTVWDWYVDRPSPLFIPPRYLVASFDHAGTLIVWHLEQTYPGGRE